MCFFVGLDYSRAVRQRARRAKPAPSPPQSAGHLLARRRRRLAFTNHGLHRKWPIAASSRRTSDLKPRAHYATDTANHLDTGQLHEDALWRNARDFFHRSSSAQVEHFRPLCAQSRPFEHLQVAELLLDSGARVASSYEPLRNRCEFFDSLASDLQPVVWSASFASCLADCLDNRPHSTGRLISSESEADLHRAPLSKARLSFKQSTGHEKDLRSSEN